MKRAIKITLLFLMMALNNSFAQKHMSLNGYTKYMQTNFIYSDPSFALLTDNLIHNRLNFKWYANAKITVAAEMRNRAFYGEYTKSIPNYGSILDNDPGFLDMAFTLVNEPSFVLHSMIDRLYTQYDAAKWNLRVGRQRINWGINTVWNPNDYFNALNYLDFDYEERPGVDAIKFQQYLGDFSNFELAIAPGKNKNSWIGAIKYATNYKGYDFQFLGAWYNTDFSVGMGWAGNLKTAGFKGEMSYFRDRANFRDTTGQLTGTVSLDYTFKKGWYTAISFLYVHNGLTQSLGASSALGLLGANPSAKQLMPTRYNFFLMTSKGISGAMNLSLSAMYAAGANMVLFFPTLAYSINNQFTLDFVVQAAMMEISNKFQHVGSGVFARLKYSF